MIDIQNVKDMSVADLEHLIEQKLVEILGDPDSGLELTDDYKKKLIERFEKQTTSISHEEVLKEFG